MRANLNFFRLSLVICLGMTCFTGLAAPATTNSAVESNSPSAEDSLRSYLQIQEQLHNLQQADEKSREEADAAAARNTQLLNQRLDQIETSLASQHWDELKDMQRANEETQHFSRLVLIASGTFAGFAFLVLLFAAFLQWTVVNRVSAMAAKLGPDFDFSAGGAAALGAGEGGKLFLGGPAGEQSTGRLLGAIASLEKRIQDMETAVQSPHSLPEGELANGGANGETNGAAHQLTAEAGPETATGKSSGIITLLLGKGQTLLRLDKIEMAVVCFDEVLAIEPLNTDALVKKGAALERLQRLDEAIQCFDRAIAVDSSMTMAYLHKGGVFNRMERYAEALECYEKALRTQEKNRSANVITE